MGNYIEVIENIAYKEHFRTLRHEMERVFLDLLAFKERGEPINEIDMLRTVKHSLSITPSIDLNG